MQQLTLGPDLWIKEAKRHLFPGGNPMSFRKYIVMHYTEGWGVPGTFDWWHNPDAKQANAHFVIDRDGALWQCRPLNVVANHAGTSTWKDRVSGQRFNQLNRISIGIEHCNLGSAQLRRLYPRSADTASFKLEGKIIPQVTAKHVLDLREKQWEPYSPPQIATSLLLCDTLVPAFNIDDILGHDEISPDRKRDPGPAFPMETFRSRYNMPR